MRFFVLTVLLTSSVLPANGQSGRAHAVPSQAEARDSAFGLSVKQMFDEANNYIQEKIAEYEAKKVPFSQRLLDQTRLEQRQLAAKYAATASARKDLTGDDVYYVGMLHWIAENLDGTIENLRKFIASENAVADRRQSARSITIVALAKQKKLEAAEALLSEYLKSEPLKSSELARMEGELAKAYKTQKEYGRMATHADNAYKALKDLSKDASSRAKWVDEIFDSGALVFEAYRDLGDQKSADAALDDLQLTAASASAPTVYYYAVDQKVKYLIETGRKSQAQEYYLTSLIRAETAFQTASMRADVITRLKKREKHYKLLGAPALELPVIDQWFPGKPKTFAELKGKVVLVDFWATWCGPCFEAFPSLREWHQDFARDGLVILGVTRYYGKVSGPWVDNAGEIAELKQFREAESIPYDFVVGKDSSIQLLYGATALPTAVLIDRKGVIRYIETGTSTQRLTQIREMILKLLAEK